jgi:hypothetical protein
MKNKKNEPKIKPKIMQLTKKTISQSFSNLKKISTEMKKDLEVVRLQKPVKLNNSLEKIKDKKIKNCVWV